jgi:hypothetical protein
MDYPEYLLRYCAEELSQLAPSAGEYGGPLEYLIEPHNWNGSDFVYFGLCNFNFQLCIGFWWMRCVLRRGY